MKNVLSSLAIAFAMYSKVPTPKVDFQKENMKYVMIFFPLVGVLVGGGVFCVLYFGGMISMSPLLLGSIATAVPILLTGGIHFDGYIDTVDAVSSYQTRERKLEILKDPHVGAFGVIYAIVYILVFFGGVCGLNSEISSILAVSLAFVLSRTVSGFLACNLVSANSGSLSFFKEASGRGICNFILIAIFACVSFCLCFLCGYFGVAVLAVTIVWAVCYKVKAYKIFGGVTGDTAGYFLQISELLSILAVAILGGVV